MSADKLVFVSDNVLLPGSDSCKSATLVVDKATGKITEGRETRSSRSDFPEIPDDAWIDVGSKWILPGLVEYYFLLH